MDDMLEYAPSTSAKFVKQMVPLFMEAMMEPGSPDLNQCAVYGLGIVAVNFSAELAPVLQQVIGTRSGYTSTPRTQTCSHTRTHTYTHTHTHTHTRTFYTHTHTHT
jgi:hypothetical protein